MKRQLHAKLQVQQQDGKLARRKTSRINTKRATIMPHHHHPTRYNSDNRHFHHVVVVACCCFIMFCCFTQVQVQAAAGGGVVTATVSWTTTKATSARYRRHARLLHSLFGNNNNNKHNNVMLLDRLQELRGGGRGGGGRAAPAASTTDSSTKQQQQQQQKQQQRLSPTESVSTAAAGTSQTGQQIISSSNDDDNSVAASSTNTNTDTTTNMAASSTSSSPPPPPPTLSNTTATTSTAATTDTTTTATTTERALIQNDDATNTSSAVAESALPQQQEEKRQEDPRVMFLIRLLFLCYYGSLGSLMPFLPVYYHSLGHGGQVIGMLGAVKPFTTFLVAPLWGLVSDQTNCPFLILTITFLVSLVGQLLVGVRHEAWYITSMVFMTAIFNAPVKSLIDSMVMDHIVDRSSYGRLRLWGQMGFGLGSSGVGLILSKSKSQYPPIEWDDISNNFSPYFENNVLPKLSKPLQSAVRYTDKCWQSLTGYKYAVLSIPAYICMQAFRRLDAAKKTLVVIVPEQSLQADTTTRTATATENVVVSNDNNQKDNNADAVTATATAAAAEPEPEHTSIGKGLVLLSQNTDALLFFFLIFCIGISSGIIENFAYVRIREVGGAGKEMGLSRLVSSLAGAPMFWFSGPLTNKFGVDRILVVSLLSYITRFVIYAAMKNPYQGLPAEALRGVTFAAFWSSATIYAHKVSPDGLHATMLLLLNAMYGGLGQSMGALLDGKLQHAVGTVWTFLYAALMDLVLVGIMIVYLGTRTGTNFHNPTPIVDTRSTATTTTVTTTSNATAVNDGAR